MHNLYFMRQLVGALLILEVFLLMTSAAAQPLQKIHCDSNKNNRFRLQDFKGDWIFLAHSVGGVDGSTGHSNTITGHFTLKGNGTGATNSLQIVTYTGPIETPLIVFDVPPSKISLILDDKKQGLGTLTINAGNTSIVFNFLAIKSGNVVTELVGHEIQAIGDPHFPSGATEYRLIRQFN